MRFNSVQYTRMLSNSLWSTGGGLNFRSGTTSDLMSTVTSYNRQQTKYAVRMAMKNASSSTSNTNSASSASDILSEYQRLSGKNKSDTESLKIEEVSRPRTSYTNNGIEEGKTSGERWDSYLEDVRKQAQKDAEKGVYMSEDFTKLQNDYMDKYVSPDRDKATAQADKVVNQVNGSYAHKYYQVKGSDTKVGVSKSSYATSAEVYNSKGEMIANKLSSNGEWKKVETKAEKYANDQTARAYADAYRAAYNSIRSAEQSKMGTGNVLDVRV